MIGKAMIEDIDQIENSYTELLTYEKENGTNSNWVLNVYPTRSTAQNAFEEGTLYVLEENGKVCASMILNQTQPKEYAGLDWTYKAVSCLLYTSYMGALLRISAAQLSHMVNTGNSAPFLSLSTQEGCFSLKLQYFLLPLSAI